MATLLDGKLKNLFFIEGAVATLPTYEYGCDSCGLHFEIVRSIKEPLLTQCPYCESEALRQIFGVPFVYAYQEPAQLGHWADRNTKKLGKAECEERELRSAEKVVDKLKRAKPPKGGRVVLPSGRKPWYRDEAKPLDMNRFVSGENGQIDAKRLSNWIETGL